ncbi:MAG: hydrophobic compound transporter HcuC [Thalassobaculales bacterium]
MGAASRPPGLAAGFRQLAAFVAPYRWRVAGAGAALVVAAATLLGLGIGLRRLVDEGFARGDSGLLDQALVALLGVVGLLALATFARFYLVSWLGERVVADVRTRVYSHLLSLDPGYFEVTRTGDLMSRLVADTTLIQSVIGSSASMFLRNCLLLVGGLAMLVVTSPRLTFLVVLVVPLVVVPILVFGRRVRALSRESQERLAAVNATGEEALNAIRTVQAFGREAGEAARFAARTEEAFRAAIRRTAARAVLTAIVIMLVFSAVSLILWIGGHDVLSGRISAGELSAFVFYAVVVAGAVGAISEVIGDLQRAAGAAERLMEVLAERPAVVAASRPLALPDPPLGTVAFEGVRFAYPARPDRPVLDGLSLTVGAGEKLALVGASGAGKTTIFQLLLRFYDPDAGRVLVDGVDLRHCDPRMARARIALVPQEPVIFSADAWTNIRYGRPEASDAEVRAAAEAAQAAGFLDRLPQGFGTFLGEKGVRLSGGQRQRLAIARAILRDAPILLLDEATSALDAESERKVQQALARLMAGRTALVIAHRLATVRAADRIAVIEEGRVVALGRHEELVRQGGLYARLAALQFGSAAERTAAAE